MDRAVSVPLLVILLSVNIFVLDLLLALGGAGDVLYVGVLLDTRWLPSGFLLVGTAMASSVLTIGGGFFSMPSHDLWTAMASRSLGLMAIWLTVAALLYLRGPVAPHVPAT